MTHNSTVLRAEVSIKHREARSPQNGVIRRVEGAHRPRRRWTSLKFQAATDVRNYLHVRHARDLVLNLLHLCRARSEQ